MSGRRSSHRRPIPVTLGAIPAELQHPFLGPAKPVEGFDAYQIDRGDLSYEGSLLAFGIGRQAAFYSIPSITDDGDLRLTSGVDGVCANGDEGTYPWSLSAGGTILTIEAGTDDCAARAQVVPGTYERSACKDSENWCLGELEAGQYSSHYFEPRPLAFWEARHGAMTYTVPSGWASYSDWPNMYGLTPLSQYQAFDRSRTIATTARAPATRSPSSASPEPPTRTASRRNRPRHRLRQAGPGRLVDRRTRDSSRPRSRTGPSAGSRQPRS